MAGGPSNELGIPGNFNDTWVGTPADIGGNYRRYLDQVGYMDTLVGGSASGWIRSRMTHSSCSSPAKASPSNRSGLAEPSRTPTCLRSHRCAVREGPGPAARRTSDRLARITDVVPTIGDWLGADSKSWANRCGSPSTATRCRSTRSTAGQSGPSCASLSSAVPSHSSASRRCRNPNGAAEGARAPTPPPLRRPPSELMRLESCIAQPFADVRLDRLRRDLQPVRDLLVHVPARDVLRDLSLA